MSDSKALRFVAVGDVVPKRKQPAEVFDLIRPALRSADISFGQLECSLSDRGSMRYGEVPDDEPCRTGNGGSSGKPPDPSGAKILSDAGFNIMSFASNHALRWGEEAMLDTIEVMKKNDIALIGAGKTVSEATKPKIIERNGSKIGFLAYCSVVPRGDWATTTRAGVASIRATTAYEKYDWQPGTPPRIITKANEEDLQGMIDDVRTLRSAVDVLVISMHWGVHYTPAVIAMYQYEIGHAAIDAGADLIIGHHTHILKGIEVYKGKAIFYSVGNCSMNPYGFDDGEIYARMGGEPRRYTMHRDHRFECEPDYRNESMPIDSQKSMMVKCDVVSGRLQRVAYQPMWLNPLEKKSQPELLNRTDARNAQVHTYMEWLCADQGLRTEFRRDDDDIVVVAK